MTWVKVVQVPKKICEIVLHKLEPIQLCFNISVPGANSNKVGWFRCQIVTLLFYGSTSCAIPSPIEMQVGLASYLTLLVSYSLSCNPVE